MSDLNDPPQLQVRAVPRRGLASLPGVQSFPQGLTLLVGDMVSALLVYTVVTAALPLVGSTPPDQPYVAIWVLVWLLTRAYQGLYPGYGKSPQSELRLHTTTTLQVAVTQFAVTFAVQDFDRSRLGLGLTWMLLYFMALPVRYLLRAALITIGAFGRPVTIIGAGQTGSLTIQHLLKHPTYGLRPVAVYDDNADLHGRTVHGVPIVGGVADAVTTPRTLHAIISIPGARAEAQRRIINQIHVAYPTTWATPDFFGVPNQALVPHNIGAVASLEVRNNLYSRRSRLIDLVVGLNILILLAPVLVVLAIIVRLDSRGPVFYRAKRLGRNLQPFECFKFRSMYENAEERLQDVLNHDPDLRAEYEMYHKLRNDPRVTRAGSFLRKWSLDELPQIMNVLRGEMSLVGPRPYLPRELEKMNGSSSIIAQVRPGITGFWQVNGRNSSTFEERLNMDRFYIGNWSPWLDIVILVQTVRVVFFGEDAY